MKEHEWLSSIFKITFDAHENDKFLLKQLYSELTSGTEEEHVKLRKDLMDTAIMERLGLIDIHALENYKDTNHPIGLQYLYSVYEDIINRITKQRDPINKNIYPKDILDYCHEIVLQYSITLLIEPDIFIFGKDCWKSFEQIINRRCIRSFLTDIRKRLTQESDITLIFGGLLKIIMKKLVAAGVESNILDPIYSDMLNLVLFYTENEIMISTLTSSDVWFGLCRETHILTGKMIEDTTIMGQLLKASVFTRTPQNMNVHFEDMSRMRDFPSISSSLQQQIKQHVEKCTLIFKRILLKKRFLNKVMIWCHLAVISNIKRNNLGSRFYQNQLNLYSSIGFSVNVLYLVLNIFAPMENDYKKLCERVQYTYCIQKHSYVDPNGYGKLNVCFNEEITMVPRSEDIQQELLSSTAFTSSESTSNNYDFFTEWFFLCPRIIQAMYIPLYQELIDNIRAIEDNNIFDELSQTEQDIIFSKNYSRKCVLFNPELKLLLLKFQTSFSVYILEKVHFSIIPSLQNQNSDQKYINNFKNPLKISNTTDKTPLITYCIPESYVADIATVVHYITNDYMNEYDCRFQPIIILFSLMMGRMDFLKNPHHRAKMAETLAYLNQIPMLNGSNIDHVSYIEKTLDTKSSTSEILIKIFPKNLLQIFIDIEFTGNANAFYQKFSYRHSMYTLVKLIIKIPLLLKRLKQISEKAEKIDVHELPLFLRFINLLTNDATYLLDEALSYLAKIKELETLKDSSEWDSLTDEDKKLKDKQLKDTIERSISYNTISVETVKALKRITTVIRKPFLTMAMKDKLAAMLNYFYFQLVSNKQSNIKVRNMHLLKFEPKKLLKTISLIYVNFENETDFIEAIANDERSYSPTLFEKAISILKKVNCPYNIIKSMENIEEKTNNIHMIKSTNDIDFKDCPDEFYDIISYEIMKDPVLLPTSNMILDRSTITRQLLSAEIDPFNRAPLTIDMVIPQPELKAKIDLWISEKKKN